MEPVTTSNPESVNAHRAATREEIAPLVALCRAGRLFEVQAWIAAGKPVNPPPRPAKGQRIKSPLDVALDLGFHSLIEVLLRGGALQEPLVGYDSPISQTLQKRRLDVIELLVAHGCDPRLVDMTEVLHSWDPKIFEFFISRGADLVTGQPFAHAFRERVRTALKPFKDLAVTRPELIEQANIALRFHCKEGDIKWASLMLWVGADPLKPGAHAPGHSPEDEEDGGLSALGYAALYNHCEIFNLKPVRLRLANIQRGDFFRYLSSGEGADVLRRLLERGWPPNDQDNGGCSMFPQLIDGLPISGRFSRVFDSWQFAAVRTKFDTTEARERLKVLGVLAKHGARWIPKDKAEITQMRRSLTQMKSDYTMEFVWIMSKYRACQLCCLKELLNTPAMKTNIAAHRDRLNILLESLEEPSAAEVSE